MANSTYQGACLFGGTQVNTQPFALDAGTNTVTYHGNGATTSVELSDGNSIKANIPDSQIFQNALQDLYTALQTGNNIPATVTEIQNALNRLGGQRAYYGNALNQINQSESFLNQEQLNLS